MFFAKGMVLAKIHLQMQTLAVVPTDSYNFGVQGDVQSRMQMSLGVRIDYS